MAVVQRWRMVLCLVALLFVACSNDPSTEVLSAGRQAVDASPGRVLTSATAREPMAPATDAVEAEPADAVVPQGSGPEALAFKSDAADAQQGSAAAPTTTTTTSTTAAPTSSPTSPTTVAPSTGPSSTAPSSTAPSTTVVTEPTLVLGPSSGCAAPRFDNGSLTDSVRAVGAVDADALDDVVVVGFDDEGLLRLVIDFGDGGQSDVGTLASFGPTGSTFRIEFTGIDRRPLRLHRGTESALVWLSDCLPVRAANG